MAEKQSYISDAFAYQSHVAYLSSTKSLAVGNYFALLVSPEVDQLEKIVNEAFGK